MMECKMYICRAIQDKKVGVMRIYFASIFFTIYHIRATIRLLLSSSIDVYFVDLLICNE